jgi:hypothetical protein
MIKPTRMQFEVLCVVGYTKRKSDKIWRFEYMHTHFHSFIIFVSPKIQSI